MKEIRLKDYSRIIIREANVNDAKKMLKYLDQISCESDFLTFGKGEFNLNLQQQEQFIESTSKQKNALFLVAEHEGEIIGNLNFSAGIRPRTMHTGEFGVSVLKDYWGKSIGTELIKYLIQWCHDSKIIKKVNLRVRTDNQSAIHVYEKLGFKIEGTITREFKINDRFYDTLFMGLNID
ncbi:GNAT family N-acetyltransferase [Alkaliphilus oremlandii]|uniref:GCN5-related N-acetyltransferase n=1 Tax=Alkaliphilus oremlandii (strain OhILAs) TaxID=350688 RepID=A8MGM0_ALKOO|nr:GNAT family protein [Alkaliphilus oremlandii]ABW19243.1 GCN5-related N-acetyltransferase [Alkaliphilus oremlandii OhILAs]